LLEITVYTTPGCVQCRPTKAKLDRAGVPFTEVDLALPENEAHAERIKAKGYLQAPVVETSDGREWGGFNPYELNDVIERFKAAE
jgi:glutaredoxin-like protein NrdH